MKLRDLKIRTKIASITVVLSLVAVGYVAFLSYKMKDLDARYSRLLDNEAQASISLARSMMRLQQMGYSAYRVMVYDGGSLEGKVAEAGFKQAELKQIENFTNAERLLPEYIKELGFLHSSSDEIVRLAGEAIAAGRNDDDAKAKQILTRLDPLLDKAFDDTAKFVQTINDHTRSSSAAMSAEINSAALTLVMLSIFVGLLGMAAAMLIAAKAITGPLSSLQNRMAELAQGNLSVVVDGQDRRDEIGEMARAVQVFKTEGLRARGLETEAADGRTAAEQQRTRTEAERAANAREQAAVVDGLAGGLARLSDGDLTVRLRDLPASYAQLEADFNTAVEKLEQALSVIASSGRSIQSGSDEIAQASDDLSQRTEQQAASLEETAAALDEITATVRATAEGARHAHDVVNTAKSGAENSGQIVQRAVAAMGEIEKSAAEISQIIGVIDEIAFQTNLLALNAGVEAARAGDSGRGFAVVASEVRALAQRSAEAAKEIKSLISTSSNQVATGVSLVGETGRSLFQIVGQVTEIAHIVSDIASSAQEQATGLNQVNTAVNQMDQITQQNAAMVEQATAASHSMKQEAQQLNSSLGLFVLSGSAKVTRLETPQRSSMKAPPARTSPPVARVGSSGVATARKIESAPDDWQEF